ncbi:unnamed protein product [Penicillium olsonii]|nr:unnamed protein product [Penicillium olsonii]
MLPENLQNSYTRYKADVNTFATWLLQSANNCGYQPHDLQTNTTPKRGKRKGKKNQLPSIPIHYDVNIKELQKLAKVVAESSLPVPEAALAIAKRAIKLRKAVTFWFLEQGYITNDMRHSKFINALEHICETLERKTDRTSKPGVKQPPSPSEALSDDANVENFTNRFTNLSVEEPCDTTAGTHPATTASRKNIKVTVVEDDNDEATQYCLGLVYFKTMCVLEDLSNMRKFISKTWSEYRDGKIDLMNAAVVTDSALQLAQDLSEDVESDWRSSLAEKMEDVPSIIFKITASIRGVDGPPSTKTGLPYDKDVADLADRCYITTKIVLESFAKVMKADHLPVFKKGAFGTYDPKAVRKQMSLDQQYKEDRIILLGILPEFCMINLFEVKRPTEDAITRSFTEFIKTKAITLGLCFTSQIFLDVHHIMRHSAEGALGDFRMSGLRIQKTIKDYQQLSRTHPQPEFWPKDYDEEIQHMGAFVKAWVLEDPLRTIGMDPKLARPGPPPEKYALLSQHATLCGLILFSFNTHMQIVGQDLLNQWGVVQGMAFLHNLVVHSRGHNELKWADMDAFIEIHGERNIFVGPRPRSVGESLYRLELQSGVSSAGNPTSDSQTGVLPDSSGETAKKIKCTTVVSNLFYARYVRGSKDTFSSFTIGRAVDELRQMLKLEPSDEFERANPEPNTARECSGYRSSDTLKLLAFLKKKLFEEEPVLLYNYFGMHRRSIELLRLIRDKEHQKFTQYFTSAYLPDESWIGGIIYLIHRVALGSAESTRPRPTTSDEAEIKSRIVMSAGCVMQEYLQKNGDVACKELRAFCKNRKPI